MTAAKTSYILVAKRSSFGNLDIPRLSLCIGSKQNRFKIEGWSIVLINKFRYSTGKKPWTYFCARESLATLALLDVLSEFVPV